MKVQTEIENIISDLDDLDTSNFNDTQMDALTESVELLNAILAEFEEFEEGFDDESE